MYNIKQDRNGKDLIAIGNFRGNITVPIGSSGSKVLSNYKNGQTDGYVVKIDGDTMLAEWAVAPGQCTECGRHYFRNLAINNEGDAIITAEVRPSKKCTRAWEARGALPCEHAPPPFDFPLHF